MKVDPHYKWAVAADLLFTRRWKAGKHITGWQGWGKEARTDRGTTPARYEIRRHTEEEASIKDQ